MDRSDGSAHLCVAGEGDVDPNGRRLDDGLESMELASVAQHRRVGYSAGGGEIFGALMPSACVTSVSRLASIALFVLIGGRIVISGPMRIPGRSLARILALVTLASIMVGILGGELLDPIGVPGIWFPFGIGVTRSQYTYAIVIPLVAFLIVRTLPASSPKQIQSGDKSPHSKSLAR